MHERNIASIQQAKQLPLTGGLAAAVLSGDYILGAPMTPLSRDSCTDTRKAEEDEEG